MKEKNWHFRGEYRPSDGGLLEALIRVRSLGGGGEAFFEGSPGEFYDPFIMKDMDRAVARVTLARELGERVTVYGDYDADGVTATYIMTETLRLLGIECGHYIPGRFDEGYGVNAAAVRAIAEAGSSLIITVDTGITAIYEAGMARVLGVDMIITDHHECPAVLPEAAAMVNPRRSDCDYPFKELSGAAVAFKLACALLGFEEAAGRFIEAAAIGTVADAMPMLDENRAIVGLGLASLESTRSLGLAELINQAGLGGRRLTASSLAFGIAPRINAAGRMENAEAALELLCCQDETTAQAVARRLCELNSLRQKIEGQMVEDCLETLEREAFFAPRDGAIVLAGEGWHNGVIGIVAARLVERYRCPAVLISLEDGIGRGSGRSVEGINLYEVLLSVRELFSRFGGHEMAAGFTINQSNIETLKQSLRDFCRERMPSGGFESGFDIDFETDIGRFTLQEVASLDKLEPYGTGNPRPVFAICGARARDMREIGGRHTKFLLESGGKTVPAIFFGVKPSEFGFEPGVAFDAAFEADIDSFGGKDKIQFIVRAVRPDEGERRKFRQELDYFRALVEGRPLKTEGLAAAVPGRPELAGIWRALTQNSRSRAVTADLRTLASCLKGERKLLKLLIALEVFGELGLVEYRLEGYYINGLLPENRSRVNLEDSGFLRRVKDLASGEADYD